MIYGQGGRGPGRELLTGTEGWGVFDPGCAVTAPRADNQAAIRANRKAPRSDRIDFFIIIIFKYFFLLFGFSHWDSPTDTGAVQNGNQSFAWCFG